VGKAAKTANGRNARLVSTGLKAAKTAKTANAFVTDVTYVTLMTLGGVEERAWGSGVGLPLVDRDTYIEGLRTAGLKAGPGSDATWRPVPGPSAHHCTSNRILGQGRAGVGLLEGSQERQEGRAR
jgi:hypothetical protein